MVDNRIWVVVHDDQTITAHDDQDHAIASAVDDEAPWIEEVTLNRAQRPSGAPLGRFQPADAPAADQTPTRHAGAKRRSWVSPPSLTIRGAWTDPWNGGDAA